MAFDYQSHGEGPKGVPYSDERLNRLRVADDLAGKSLFNIAFNERFFCNIAAQRGARRVVGIDSYAPSWEIIGAARRKWQPHGWATVSPDSPRPIVKKRGGKRAACGTGANRACPVASVEQP
jgi:hypothetical protein